MLNFSTAVVGYDILVVRHDTNKAVAFTDYSLAVDAAKLLNELPSDEAEVHWQMFVNPINVTI